MIKQKIAAIVVAAVATTAMAVTASAVQNYGFTLKPRTSVTRVTTEQKYKEDNEDAVVNLQSGLRNDYVTFRIRTPGTNTARIQLCGRRFVQKVLLIVLERLRI